MSEKTGFTTASGKPIFVSQESLKTARAKIEEDNEEVAAPFLTTTVLEDSPRSDVACASQGSSQSVFSPWDIGASLEAVLDQMEVEGNDPVPALQFPGVFDLNRQIQSVEVKVTRAYGLTYKVLDETPYYVSKAVGDRMMESRGMQNADSLKTSPFGTMRSGQERQVAQCLQPMDGGSELQVVRKLRCVEMVSGRRAVILVSEEWQRNFPFIEGRLYSFTNLIIHNTNNERGEVELVASPGTVITKKAADAVASAVGLDFGRKFYPISDILNWSELHALHDEVDTGGKVVGVLDYSANDGQIVVIADSAGNEIRLRSCFSLWASGLDDVLKPGAHVIVKNAVVISPFSQNNGILFVVDTTVIEKAGDEMMDCEGGAGNRKRKDLDGAGVEDGYDDGKAKKFKRGQ